MKLCDGKKLGLRLTTASLSVVLAACGGGGGGSDASPIAGTTAVVTPSPVTGQKCSPNNPYRYDDSPFSTTGTLADEKAWLKDNMEKNYLWYQDMPVVDAALPAYSKESATLASVEAYFNALKSPLLTASGAKKDKYSFVISTREWNGWQAGASLEYGIQWHVTGDAVPYTVRVAYVQPNSPAALAGVARGDQLKTVDGLVADGSVSGLGALLYPTNSAAHNLIFDRAGTVKNVTIAAANITISPVPVAQTLDVAGDKVGYLVFNTHISSAEKPLMDAMEKFKADQVKSLVLDLRYNGGGLVDVASVLAYMVAGKTATSGKPFDKLQYSDKRPVQTALGVVPFYEKSSDGKVLPSLNLKQVFILATGSTCSASEAIINGLRGVDIDVQIIGKTTCGKPYAFVGKSNCGVTYLPIESKGANAKGFDDYSDGFAPNCSASDDFSQPLGSATEGMLAAALYRRANPNACKAAALGSAGKNAAGMVQESNGYLIKPEIMQNQYWTTR